MREQNVPQTSFITPFGTYCYETMPFGLKNVECTYQRTIQKAFCTHIEENIKVYIDDLVVKSKQRDRLILILEQTFENLQKFKIMLNPTKCVFGVMAEKSWVSWSQAHGSRPTQERSTPS